MVFPPSPWNCPTKSGDRYLRFYGADRWLRYRDLDYVGPKSGWGPSPPDQYSLNRARAEIRGETEQPYLLFTITQNSHYPWAPLPVLAADWTQLNVAGDDPAPIDAEGIPHETRRQNYLDAVEYDLRVLVDFILNEEDPNALFVLIGDHQPPRVSRKEDGWETPIHIISRDGALVERLAEYGFVPGLNLPAKLRS
jgi:phosphoglycerol transferase MdoB-like AlkP superfamily enzyme